MFCPLPGVKDKSNFQDYKYLVLDGLKYCYSYTSLNSKVQSLSVKIIG
jgi:hypothetical protein